MKNRWWLALAAVLTIAILPFSGSPQSVPGPDYVNSRLCAECHPKIYESYQRTGMARSFYRPTPGNTVENYSLNNSYYHAASATWFTMLERNGKYYQRRYQIGYQGNETNVDDKEIDFVLGSGNHVRTYLHQTSTGALLQLPLAWYSENGGYWAMNPGYDKPDQPNARRKISLECMFCHNSFPELAAGHDQLRSEPLFNGALPQGIDCQRCHGPGGNHIQTAHSTGASAATIAQSIVNPKRLTPARRMEVCLQCHLETDSMPFARSIVKYDRGPFSYRPGEPLGNFMLFFDHAPSSPREDRFQIVNSAYRLDMSACFRKSNGALQCTTCHNPHNIPRGDEAPRRDEAARIYNGACLGCHTMPIRETAAARQHTAAADCVSCHMPKRRASDVVHAVMTDHYIRRRPPGGDLLRAMPEPSGPGILYRGEVLPYYPKPFDPTPENELYLALAQVRENNNPQKGIARFAAAVAKYKPKHPGFYIELADAWLGQGNSRQAIPLYREAVRRQPDSLAGLTGLGRALEKSGQMAEAAAAFRGATQASPADAASWRELGQLAVKQGNQAEAVTALEKSLALDTESPEARYGLGLLWSQPGGDPRRAEASFREAIRLQPDYAEAHLNLAILLIQTQRTDEAGYHFQTALRYHPDYALGHFNYGLMLNSLNQTTEGMSQMRAALRANPNLAEAHEELGKIAEGNGQVEEALREYAEAVRIRPQLLRAQLGLGAALARKGNSTEAVPHLKQAATSLDPLTRDTALRLLAELGR